MIAKDKIARIVLLGNEQNILNQIGTLPAGVEIVDPAVSEKRKDYAGLLFDLRKEKGMTSGEAERLSHDAMYFGCLMVRAGDADGMVSGAIHATGDLLRPALQIIKPRPGIKTVSSCFVMALPKGSKYGENGVMVFGDCAVIPSPTAEQLADIARSSAETAVKIAGIKSPKIALLSFSTKGSAKHENADKVIEALKLIKSSPFPYEVDGELQLDAAIVPEVGRLKAPGSAVAGKASVLIFPDLQSGNIGYKLVQRFGGAEAIGPICQGLNKPVNDLSRGCVAEDIVGVVAITALQY
jgi:phosphate acetyltransferase